MAARCRTAARLWAELAIPGENQRSHSRASEPGDVRVFLLRHVLLRETGSEVGSSPAGRTASAGVHVGGAGPEARHAFPIAPGEPFRAPHLLSRLLVTAVQLRVAEFRAAAGGV